LKQIGKTLSKTASSVLRWIVKPFVWLWVKYFVNEWEVTVWYDPSKKTIYHFKSISIIESTHLQGKLVTDEPFELKTQEPFNYQVKKVK
jgi:hypothetical protein